MYSMYGWMDEWMDATAVAQEVRAVVWQQEGCWFGLRLAKCRGVPEQDTT